MSTLTSRSSRDLEAPVDEVNVTYVGIPGTDLSLRRVRWKLWEPDKETKRKYIKSVSSPLQSMKVWEHLSKKELFQPSVAFGFYKIGRERTEARHCITIRTNSVNYGKKMRNAVLEQDWWVGFKASVPGACVMYIYCCPKKLAGPPFPLSTNSMPGDVFTFEDVRTYCGAPIFIEVRDGGTTSQRPATLGGLLDVGGSVYGLIVAHAASEDYVHEQESFGEPMLYVHPDDEYNNIEASEHSDPEQPSAYDAVHYDALPNESVLHVLRRFLPSWVAGPEFGPLPSGHSYVSREIPKKLGSIHRISSEFNEDLCDWAIVQLDTSNFATRRVNELNIGWLRTQISTKLASESESSAIVAVTGSSGFVNGHLLSTPVLFQMEPETSPLEVKEVVLEKELRFGDSGSWVFNESGKPYGVIVAGVTGSRVAYVVPLAVVIQDMKQRLDTTVRLPEVGFWDSFIQGIGRLVTFQMFITIARHLLGF